MDLTLTLKDKIKLEQLLIGEIFSQRKEVYKMIEIMFSIMTAPITIVVIVCILLLIALLLIYRKTEVSEFEGYLASYEDGDAYS